MKENDLQSRIGVVERQDYKEVKYEYDRRIIDEQFNSFAGLR